MPDLGIQRVIPATYIPKGYQKITGLNTAKGLTVPTNSSIAIIQALTKNVRYRDDGTAPTASIGMQIAAGDSLVYHGSLSAIKFIEESASAEINVLYYDTSALDN